MISVIIPAYNRENTIQNSIYSVLNQSMQDFEIIVVDDSSTDKTREKVMEICDGRIHYFRTSKNLGAAGARNEGLDRAKGEYIAFHDSDDIMKKDKLESELHFLETNKYDAVYSQLERFDLDGQFLGIQPINCHTCKSLDETYMYFLWEGRVWTQTLFAKRECFAEIRFDETMRCNEDWEISLRLAQRYRIGFIEKPLTKAYVQINSISTDELKALQSYEYLFKKYKQDIEKNIELKKHWKERMFFSRWNLGQVNFVECFSEMIRTKDIKWIIRAILPASRYNKLKHILK